jgi:hypothetical protein
MSIPPKAATAVITGSDASSCAQVHSRATQYSYNSKAAAQSPTTTLLRTAERRDSPTTATSRREGAGLIRQRHRNSFELVRPRRLLVCHGALRVFVKSQAAADGALGESS